MSTVQRDRIKEFESEVSQGESPEDRQKRAQGGLNTNPNRCS
jgi:hypothetical protein